MYIRKVLGANVRELREQTGLSQAAFARMTDIDRSHLNALEQGKGNPRVATLIRIADGLDVPITQLFAGADGCAPRLVPEPHVTYNVQPLPQKGPDLLTSGRAGAAADTQKHKAKAPGAAEAPSGASGELGTPGASGTGSTSGASGSSGTAGTSGASGSSPKKK